MNNFTDLLTIERIAIDVSFQTKKEGFSFLAQLFSPHPQEVQMIEKKLWERENEASTAIGKGIAIPHTRISTFKKPIAAFMKCATPLPYETPDQEPVDLIFALIGTEKDPTTILEIWAQVAEFFYDSNSRQRLRYLLTAEEMLNFMIHWQPIG